MALGSGIKLPANAGDTGDEFHVWVSKIPRRRAWQSTPVFLPRESHGQRSLVGYSRGVAQSQTQWKQLSIHACKLPISEGRRRDEARVAVSYVAQIQMRRRRELKIMEK